MEGVYRRQGFCASHETDEAGVSRLFKRLRPGENRANRPLVSFAPSFPLAGIPVDQSSERQHCSRIIMSKKCLLIFSANHTSKNIASLRFKLLTKYIDFSEYEVHIFSHTAAGPPQSTAADGPDIHIHEADRYPEGRIARLLNPILVVASAFASRLPSWVAVMGSKERKGWLVNSISMAEKIAARKKSAGDAVVVVGTYSPVEALIAAKALSRKYKLPCLLDFRDGLVFESLGRKGMLYTPLRKAMERTLVAQADLITSVGKTLVEYFRSAYPGKRVEYLPNGFDRSEFVEAQATIDSSEESKLSAIAAPGEIIIGHFGRISSSDASSIQALKFLVARINQAHDLSKNLHFVFVGDLNDNDLMLLKRIKPRTTILPPMDREAILRFMTKCHFLLLITGDRTSCATGKIFEYLAAGPEIVCFSAVENEASYIIKASNSGRTILVGDDQGAERILSAISSADRITDGPRGNTDIFSKPEQAAMFMRWMNQLAHGDAYT